MNKIYCPNCYSEFENQPDFCACGYPFNGTEMDKYKFMSVRIKKEKTILEGVESATYSRYILFLIGGVNLIVAIIQIFFGESDNNTVNLVTAIYSIILIGLGFLSYKEPFYSLLLGFILILVIYLVIGLVDLKLLLSGFLFKIIFICGFIYGLYKIKQAENLVQKS